MRVQLLLKSTLNEDSFLGQNTPLSTYVRSELLQYLQLYQLQVTTWVLSQRRLARSCKFLTDIAWYECFISCLDSFWRTPFLNIVPGLQLYVILIPYFPVFGRLYTLIVLRAYRARLWKKTLITRFRGHAWYTGLNDSGPPGSNVEPRGDRPASVHIKWPKLSWLCLKMVQNIHNQSWKCRAST